MKTRVSLRTFVHDCSKFSVSVQGPTSGGPEFRVLAGGSRVPGPT